MPSRYIGQSPKTLYRITKNQPGFHAKVMKRYTRLKALIEQHIFSLILFQPFEKDRFLKKRQKKPTYAKLGCLAT
jgi:hypothetical protein